MPNDNNVALAAGQVWTPTKPPRPVDFWIRRTEELLAERNILEWLLAEKDHILNTICGPGMTSINDGRTWTVTDDYKYYLKETP